MTTATRTAQLTREDLKVIPQVAVTAPRRAARPWAVIGLVVFGAASLALYGMFFGFIDDIFSLLTSGTVGGAAAVIFLALTFSLVHASFAGALLEVVGIRELKKE